MTPDNPFAPVHSRESFLETVGGGEALRRLDDGLGAREPFLLLTGGPGTGKTALAREAVERWGARVTAAFPAFSALTGAECLEEIVRRLGAEPPDGATRSKLLACVERALAEITSRGQVALIVVDDAHDLSRDLLEELRLLVNAAQQVRRPLEVLLIGLPTLEARLDEPALVALRQRVSVRASLEPLSAGETRRYLHHRVTAAGGDGPGLFSRKTCRDIAARTRGVPRQINALAAEALRVARAWGDQTVGPEHVQTAAAALGGFVPAGGVADAGDDGSEDSHAPAAAASPVASAKAAAVQPTAATTPAPVAPRATAPAAAPALAPAAAPAAAPAPASPRSTAPAVAPPAAPVVARPPAPVVAPAPPAVVAPTAAPVAARAPAAAVPPSPAPVAAPAPTPKPRPSPPAEPVVRTASPSTTPAEPEPAIMRADVGIATPNPSLVGHDPREWVARFVGDHPLRLSSRAVAEAAWEAEPSETSAAESSSSAEAPPRPRTRPAASRPRSRSRHTGVLRMASAALLAAIVVVAAVALVIRVSGLARNHAAQVAAVTTTATAPPDAGKASSSAATRAGSRTARASLPARAGERREDNSTAGSRRTYALDVGGGLDLDRAYEERDRLQRLTGFEGWIVPDADGRGTYRIVLGAYRSQERATSAANMLLNSKTLSDVTVIPLPPRRVRR